MKCITYGTLILLIAILTIVVAMVSVISPPIGAIASLASFGFVIWWIMGFFDDCEDGYLLSDRLKKMPVAEMPKPQ